MLDSPVFSSAIIHSLINDEAADCSGDGLDMMLIRLPDELFNRVAEISENLSKSIGDYLTELLEQAVRVHELGCSVKDAVDLYERTVKERKTTEEAELVEGPSVAEVFERMLESKLRPDIGESEERKMLSRFLSQLSES